ncbi:uncharacterized protein LOC128014650 isoform X2 [Carassius gibelio]|uniref:uncharacterized protein LOC128014650 isoform X2 n=1 Tax=Carassius gibelio TaxID=101364 RepID=UPI002278DEBD|nr:uncharacterized protein LOC128014650 isoform X2 [Carassius gibelio]
MYIKVSEIFKLRLKKEFQKLNDVFIGPHITEKPDLHISDIREFEGQNIRTVLMKGDAGTGKTVTVQKFILDWAEEKSSTHIDYIFPIPFQKLNIIREKLKECSFMELLQQCCENTEYLKLHYSDRIMLIFDGLNEFNDPLDFQNRKIITDIHKRASVSDLLSNLIMGNLLPDAQIWITSRPAAANPIPDRFIDRVTEIQGFDDQQKQEYFRRSSSDQRMSDKVIRHIQKSPRISSMCYSPDYCRIISEIPEKMFSTDPDDFPKTLTQMYSRLLLAQTERIPQRREIIIALGRIAFHLLVNRNSLFSHEDLKKCEIRDESDLIHSSIIKKIEDKRKSTSFCFVNHRTQEFLAALYVTEVINVNNPRQLRDLSSLKLDYGEMCFTEYCLLQNVMDNTLERQMDLFFCFLLGLTLESSQRALKDLLTKRRRSSSSSQLTVQHIKTLIMKTSPENTDKHSLLFDALKELDERYLIQEIKTHLKSGLELSPAQISSLLISEEQQIQSHRSENLRRAKGTPGLSDACIPGRNEHAQSESPEQDDTRTKPSMINPESHTQNPSSVLEMFKKRLKDEFQYLNKKPDEGQKPNDVFIEPHITEKPDFHISDKRQITCKNMFNIRTVLMKGDAGTGKSVTVQKFILDWTEEKSNSDIKYIFPIPFQKLNIIRETVKKCSFMELLQQCCENTEYLKLHYSDRIMLIFDGLNEFNDPLDFQNRKIITDIHKRASVSDLLSNLIMGNLLPDAQIWITSRPAAANPIPDRFIDRVTEIQGFDDQQKQEYFRRSIRDQRMSDKVIRHIQKSPRISSMCYSPDYCRIISEIPEKMFSTDPDDFPKTLTQMYSRLLLAQTERIPQRREIIIALGRIAFHLLVNRNSLFSHEDLKKCEIRDESDLIRSSIIKKIEDKSKSKSFCFVNHRTQEFLAALYVTEVINVNNPLQLRDLSSLKPELGESKFTYDFSLQDVMESALERQMDLFFCFLLGLTLESSQRALKDLLTQRRRSSSSSQLTVQHIKTLIMKTSPENTDKKQHLLFDALKELDERYLIQEIKTQLKSGPRLSPAQISALSPVRR